MMRHLVFFDEMMDLKIPLSKEVCSSAICAYSKQVKLMKAESVFDLMKADGFCPDVVMYTAMLHAYIAAENWEKACTLFEEMETIGIQLDSIACSTVMRALNKGGQSSKVLILAEHMREKGIPFSDSIFFEIISACSLLRDWKTTIDLIKLMEPSLPVVSTGIINQLLHFLGRSGKVEIMMKLFYKIVASGAEINSSTYSILLKKLLSAGNWRKYIEVLQWMEDAGIQPSNSMYLDISTYAQKSGGADYAAIIQERLDSLKRKTVDRDSTTRPCASTCLPLH